MNVLVIILAGLVGAIIGYTLGLDAGAAYLVGLIMSAVIVKIGTRG